MVADRKRQRSQWRRDQFCHDYHWLSMVQNTKMQPFRRPWDQMVKVAWVISRCRRDDHHHLLRGAQCASCVSMTEKEERSCRSQGELRALTYAKVRMAADHLSKFIIPRRHRLNGACVPVIE
jgi:hypothetical protein